MNLLTTRHVTYTAPPTADQAAALDEIAATAPDPGRKPAARRAELARVGTVSQMRATIATHSALARHRYFVYLRQIDEMIQAETGKEWEQARETQEGTDLFIMGLHWAIGISSLIRLEQREISPLLADDAEPWTEIDLPAAWKTPMGYLGSVSPEFAGQLARAAQDINPDLLNTGGDGDVKKRGGVTVS